MTDLLSTEKTFLLLKPDAIQRGLIGTIISRLENKGMQILSMKMVQVTQDQAMRQYACHKDKPFFDSLVEFITSSPCVALVVKGRNAIKLCRSLMGATDPAESLPGTIRGDFSSDTKHNLIHGSDSPESYEHEVKVYFTEDEIHTFSLAIEPWIYYN